MIKKCCAIFIIVFVVGTLASCASDNANAPCANFGAGCSKTPINSWDYHQ